MYTFDVCDISADAWRTFVARGSGRAGEVGLGLRMAAKCPHSYTTDSATHHLLVPMGR